MCAILGIQSKEIVDMQLFREMLSQSMIRGKHATGIAWIENDNIKTYVMPETAEDFTLPDIETNTIIGHCRYSTSDLEYNQPVFSDKVAVAHNGVITQADPETWEETYNLKFTTKCDSEIILRTWENQSHPLKLHGSMATLLIDTRQQNALHFFRNEQRPLYYAATENTFFIASTKDILLRSGIAECEKTEPCVDYTIINNKMRKSLIREVIEDLQ
jgi:glutamine phosphoribosylpyrophosphate amidotransferase